MLSFRAKSTITSTTIGAAAFLFAVRDTALFRLWHITRNTLPSFITYAAIAKVAFSVYAWMFALQRDDHHVVAVIRLGDGVSGVDCYLQLITARFDSCYINPLTIKPVGIPISPSHLQSLKFVKVFASGVDLRISHDALRVDDGGTALPTDMGFVRVEVTQHELYPVHEVGMIMALMPNEMGIPRSHIVSRIPHKQICFTV